MLGFIIAGVIAILLIIFIAMSYIKCPPDMVYLISGLRKEARVITGKATIRIPFLERVDKIPLKLIQIDVRANKVPTNDFINVDVDAVANVRISTKPELIRIAAKHFLNQGTAEIASNVQQILEGNMREIIGQMQLVDAGIPYIWTIFTNDTRVIQHPKIIFMEPQLNIRDYIAKADYTVQLSDTEAYCYTMIESLLLNVPVIVTPWACLKELNITNDYGFILPFDMTNIPVDEIYNKKFNFKYNLKPDNWNQILELSKSTYKEELNSIYTVEALSVYQNNKLVDAELGHIPEPGEVWDVSKERFDLLAGENKRGIQFVKLVNKKPISL